jgi:hypothetical protein
VLASFVGKRAVARRFSYLNFIDKNHALAKVRQFYHHLEGLPEADRILS